MKRKKISFLNMAVKVVAMKEKSYLGVGCIELSLPTSVVVQEEDLLVDFAHRKII